jgi:hypothetical protein
MNWARIRLTKAYSVAAATVASCAAITLGLAVTSSHSGMAANEGPPSPCATHYLPSISDMMMATIQPRHTRLWLAARERNSAFAASELGNLHGAFKRLGQAHPTEHDILFPEMIESVTEQPFAELDDAINAKDETAFAKAYADLTDGCNSSHQALNHGVVAIRVPGSLADSD